MAMVREGSPIGGNPVLVASGAMVQECMKAAEGTTWSVLDLYRPHPIDRRHFDDLTHGRPVLVVEDNLESPIARALGVRGICPPEYLFEYGTEAELLAKAGLDAASIRRAV